MFTLPVCCFCSILSVYSSWFTHQTVRPPGHRVTSTLAYSPMGASSINNRRIYQYGESLHSHDSPHRCQPQGLWHSQSFCSQFLSSTPSYLAPSAWFLLTSGFYDLKFPLEVSLIPSVGIGFPSPSSHFVQLEPGHWHMGDHYLLLVFTPQTPLN